MLYKVFDFADKEASDVMVPRPEVVGISVEMPPEEALRAVLESPYTRYPVFRGSLDEIVGVLHVRDLVSALTTAASPRSSSQTLLRPAYVVPETKDLAALLAEFRRTNQHMAVVVDEYGATQGIVTLEDLLEEIVGEIEDEFDLPDESVERIDETTIRIDGTFPIDDFNEQFGTTLEHEDYHTVAGYVFDLLGRAAEPGDEVATDGCASRARDEARGSSGSRSSSCRSPGARATRKARRRRPGRDAGARRLAVSAPRFRCSSSASCSRPGFAIEMSFVAIGWQVYAVHSNPLDLGLVGLAMFIPLPLLALPAGHLADRFPRRTLLAIATGARRRGHGRAALRHPGRSRPTWPFFALAFGTGVASALGAPAVAGADAVTRPARDPRAGARAAVGRVPGVRDRRACDRRPAVRGAFGARLRRPAALSVALPRRVARSSAPAVIRLGGSSPDLASVLGGVRLVRRTPVLLGAISLDLFAVLFGGAVALLPVFAKDVLDVGPAGLGVLRAAPAVGALCSAHHPLPLARRPARRPEAAHGRRASTGSRSSSSGSRTRCGFRCSRSPSAAGSTW